MPRCCTKVDSLSCLVTRALAIACAVAAMILLPVSYGNSADKFWNTSGTSATWTSTNWGTVSGGPFTSGWSANDKAIFEATSLITYVTTTDVGNIDVTNASKVTMTAAGTYTTGGAVRTLNVGAGSILDFAGQVISTASGTGFVKSGGGIFFTSNGNLYTGGFALNDGTIIIGGVNALGGAGPLTINGGTLAANNTRTIPAGKYTSITIGGDFTMGAVTTGVTSGNGSATASISFADPMALGAATRAITIGSNATYTLSGALSGSAGTGLTVNAASGATGVLALGGTNTFTGALTINNGATVSISTTNGGNLGANGNTVTINGGTLQTTNGSQLISNHTLDVSGSGTINGTGAGTVFWDGAVNAATSTTTLTKAGGNIFSFRGTNNFLGKYIVTGGQLNGNNSDAGFGPDPGSPVADYFLLNGGQLRASASYTISSNRGITLGTNGGGFDVNTIAGAALTYNGIIAGAAGTGGLTKNSAESLVLGGASTYTGKTIVANGTLSVASLNKVTAGSPSSNLGAPTTVANGTIGLGSTTTAGTLSYTGAGETTDRVIDLAGSTGGAAIDSSGTGALSFTSNFTATGGGAKTLTLQGSNTGANTISGAIVDNTTTNKTSLTKSGSGNWALAGANTYTGATTVSAGTLQVGSGSTSGSLSTSSAITTNANLSFNRSDTITQGTHFANGIAGTGSVTQAGGGTLNLSGTNSYSGGTKITAGTLSANSAGALGANSNVSNVTISTGATLNVGALQTIHSLNSASGQTGAVTLGANELTIGSTSTNLSSTFAGSISDSGGSGSIVKAGTGTLILSGNSTYGSGTTINGGTVQANNSPGSGSATGTGAVAITSGATLAGTGSITGGVFVNNGGHLAPGTSIESLDTGPLTFNAGGNFDYEINSAASLSAAADLVNANGGLTITSGAKLNVSDSANTFLTNGTKFTLISYAGSWNLTPFQDAGGNPLADNSLITVGVNTYRLKYADASGGGSNFDGGSFAKFATLTVAVVPEANAAYLGSFLCGVLGLAYLGTSFWNRYASLRRS